MEVYAEGAELSSGYVVSSTKPLPSQISLSLFIIVSFIGLALSSKYNLQDTRIVTLTRVVEILPFHDKLYYIQRVISIQRVINNHKVVQEKS